MCMNLLKNFLLILPSWILKKIWPFYSFESWRFWCQCFSLYIFFFLMILTMGLLIFLILLIITVMNLLFLDPMLLKGLSESPTNKPLLKSCFLDIDKKTWKMWTEEVRKQINFWILFFFLFLLFVEFWIFFLIFVYVVYKQGLGVQPLY
jgi:hypothetical protein